MTAISDRIYSKLSRVARRVGYELQGVSDIHTFAGNPRDIPQAERVATPMHKAFYENNGAMVHKWRGYLDHYHQHLSRFIGSPVRVLEIGVSKGGSLQMWRRYFGPSAVIFGIDIDPTCKQYDGVAGSVRIGSQDDTVFLNQVVAEMGGVDVVIDDGSHVARHQRKSFDVLFPKIDPNGVYICEDTHTAYWRGPYEGGHGRKTNILEIAKKLIDDIHAEFHAKPISIERANRTIKGIHFYNSMFVVEKAPQPPSSHLQVS